MRDSGLRAPPLNGQLPGRLVSRPSEGGRRISKIAYLMSVDGGHDVTILETSDDGQDVPVFIEHDAAPRTRLSLGAVAGIAHVSVVMTSGHMSVTIAGANRDFSCGRTGSIDGSAWVIRPSSAKALTRMRRNEGVNRRKRMKCLCVLRTRIMRPRRLEFATLSHKCSQGESRRTEKGRGSSSPLSAS
jgi:hypothetical protein